MLTLHGEAAPPPVDSSASSDAAPTPMRRWRICLVRRQEHAWLAGARDVEVIPGAGAGHEQDAAFPLQVLGMRDGVFAFWGDRRWIRNQALFNADNSDGLEFQAFHRVHGVGAHGARPAAAAQRDRHDAVGFQRLACLANQAVGPGRHADGLRLDADLQPRADPLGKKSEFFARGSRPPEAEGARHASGDR